MKLFHHITLVVTLGIISLQAHAEREYKPFVLASTTSGDLTQVKGQIVEKLKSGGYEVVGDYSPYNGAQIVIITNDKLKQNAAKSEFGGYGTAQRVAFTEVNKEIQISYTNPTYMANVYRMDSNLADVSSSLESLLGKEKEFGPEKGLSSEDLREYHYMFGMEYFDDYSDHELVEHASYEDAVKTIERNLAKKVAGVSKVYRIDIPGKQETLFGVDIDTDDGAEKAASDDFIMSEVDFKEIRSTAHLPVEMLVSDNKVYGLYYRFRIAINFPDLSMMGSNSFMNVVESPEAAKKAMTLVAGGEVD